ncbi:MAG: flagellar type III secretion system protein FlhB [Burkholderiales bacterium]|nr:flagellar type III secretion system protein FlhB [Burkholderiales bacterium]
MAEESDLERSEPASPRRLEQARERGQVPRSPELSTFAVLMSAGAGLLLLGGALMDALFNIVRAGLTLDRSSAFDTSQLGMRLFETAATALLGLAPWFLLVAAAAIVASMMVSGWLFTFEALQPNFSRLSPLRGLGRIFSWHGLIELGKAVLKSLLVGGVAAWAIWSERATILALVGESLQGGLAHLAQLLGHTFLLVAGALLLVVVIDVPFRLWEHARQLRMTKEEVRQEMKETEGDPQIKARIRSLQREAARRRMMAEVPQADVVVTNPDHYAVALRYSEGRSGAPRVVAKGSMLVAQRIIELAEASRVPILRAPPLARALFVHADLGREIPAALYNAVAEVLAWVYQLRRYRSAGGEVPREPTAIAVPPDLDPGENFAEARA